MVDHSVMWRGSEEPDPEEDGRENIETETDEEGREEAGNSMQSEEDKGADG